MKNVFISFSSAQEDEANRICSLLEKNGIECFISTRDLIAGKEYASQLLDNIDGADAVVLLLSKDSNNSPHVLREVEYAVSHKTPILVYALERVELSKSLEYFLMTHQWITDSDSKDRRLVDSVYHIMDSNGNLDSNNIKEFKAVLSGNSLSDNELYNKENTGKDKKESKSVIMMIVIGILLLLVIILLVMILKFSQKTANVEVNSVEELNTELDKKAEEKSKKIEDEEIDNNKNVNNEKDFVNTKYEIGQYVILGNYYDKPIEWRIIKINEDNTMILLSKDILCMKIYDAAEGGKYNEYQGVDYWSYENHVIDNDDIAIMVRGSNDWNKSNIRTWLNSDKEVVDYKDQAPTKTAAGANFYSSEPGFLYGFSEEEKNAIVSVEHQTGTDNVFLLSSAELKWLKDAGISIYAKPTEQCLANDKESFYYAAFTEYSKVESYYWWLRDSAGAKSNEVNLVVTEYEDDRSYITQSVGASAYGVRPAICVDMTSEALVIVEK